MYRELSVYMLVLSAFGPSLANAQSENSLANRLASSPDPFQTLKEAFDSAGPAKAEDYPRIEELNPSVAKLRCVEISSGDSSLIPDGSQLCDVRIGRLDVVVPGTPNNGPLLPGTPDKTVTVLTGPFVQNNKDAEASPQEFVKNLDDYKLRLSTGTLPNGELRTTMTTPLAPAYLNVVTYRKSGSNLYFHEEATQGDAAKADGYGYCFPR